MGRNFSHHIKTTSTVDFIHIYKKHLDLWLSCLSIEPCKYDENIDVSMHFIFLSNFVNKLLGNM